MLPVAWKGMEQSITVENEIYGRKAFQARLHNFGDGGDYFTQIVSSDVTVAI